MITNKVWCQKLSEEERMKILPLIQKVPYLNDFLINNDGDDLIYLLDEFCTSSEYDDNCKDNINFKILRKRYLSAIELPNNVEFFDIYDINSWHPLPIWAKGLSKKSIFHLNELILHVSGLHEFIERNPLFTNLVEIIDKYENTKSCYDHSTRFFLNSIRERYECMMEECTNALHYVSKSHKTNDYILVQKFFEEANKEYYNKLSSEDCSIKFKKNYLHTYNPFVSSEIAVHELRHQNYDAAFTFLLQTFYTIFSCPNIYWNNKESIYGCASLVETIIDTLDEKTTSILNTKFSDKLSILFELSYLLFSRICYWNDSLKNYEEKYDNESLPIRTNDKIRFRFARQKLIANYGKSMELFENSSDVGNLIQYADLRELHILANKMSVLGSNSRYKQDADLLFNKSGLRLEYSPDSAYEAGRKLNEEISYKTYLKYKRGEYSLDHETIVDFVENLHSVVANHKLLFQNKFSVIQEVEIPNIGISYKSNRDLIHKYLCDNDINVFYHFTDISNIPSIIKSGGLLSYKQCLDRGIALPRSKDSQISRDKDAVYDLEDYIRTSFCKRLPKIEERKLAGQKLVMLKISTEIAEFENTMFADREATHEHNHGPGFEDLKRVKLDVVKKDYYADTDPEYLYFQAEVMVKGGIPLKFILNIESPNPI